MTTLRCGDWELSIRPELGGSIGALTWHGQDILRPTPADASDPLQTACFPLVPWANRIACGRFSFEGAPVDLGPTPGFEPHALHGEGWRAPWALLDQTDTAIALGLHHDRGRWPWAWSAQQTMTLDEHGLRIDLSVTNEDERPMPAGAGLHPYFVRRPGDTLAFKAAGVWATRPDAIPDRLTNLDEVVDWNEGPRLDDSAAVDHAYEDWSQEAFLTSAGHRVRLSASEDASFLHVFTPPAEAFCCMEPVTHRPNAHNALSEESTGLRRLERGASLSIWMRISAEQRGT